MGYHQFATRSPLHKDQAWKNELLDSLADLPALLPTHTEAEEYSVCSARQPTPWIPSNPLCPEILWQCLSGPPRGAAAGGIAEKVVLFIKETTSHKLLYPPLEGATQHNFHGNAVIIAFKVQ